MKFYFCVALVLFVSSSEAGWFWTRKTNAEKSTFKIPPANTSKNDKSRIEVQTNQRDRQRNSNAVEEKSKCQKNDENFFYLRNYLGRN